MITTFGLDKFLRHQHQKLLVAGIAGSGKSTLGKQLAEMLRCSFQDFDDFFRQNRDIKMQNFDAYIQKRALFEVELFFSHRRAVVAGLGPILRNINKQQIYHFPIIIIDIPVWLANYRGIKRNIISIFKNKLFRYWFNELIFVPKVNYSYRSDIFKVKKIFAEAHLDSVTMTFDSVEKLLEYCVNFKKHIHNVQ